MNLSFPVSLSIKAGHKHAVLCFCFLELGIRSSVFTEFKLNQVNLPLDLFFVISKMLKVLAAGG